MYSAGMKDSLAITKTYSQKFELLLFFAFLAPLAHTFQGLIRQSNWSPLSSRSTPMFTQKYRIQVNHPPDICC